MSNRQVRWSWTVEDSATVLHLVFPDVGMAIHLKRRPFQRHWYIDAKPPLAISFVGRRTKTAIKIVRDRYATALAEKFAEVTHVDAT